MSSYGYELTLFISALFAAGAAIAAWSLRDYLQQRIERDVKWLNETREAFVPDPPDSRKYVLMIYAAMFVGLLPVAILFLPPLFGIVMWCGIWLLPIPILNWCWKKRLREIDQQLPMSIRKFASLCQAGLSAADALRQLSIETPYPLRYEYRVMANSWRMGVDLPEVVGMAMRRLKLESFRLFYGAIAANRELGGNLVATLEKVAGALVSQNELRKEVDAALAEGRMNIYGLLAAPPIMLLIITIMDYEAVELFFHTLLGWEIFGAALLIISIGIFWAWRITKIVI